MVDHYIIETQEYECLREGRQKTHAVIDQGKKD